MAGIGAPDARTAASRARNGADVRAGAGAAAAGGAASGAAAAKRAVKKHYTDEEAKARLVGHIELPRDMWPSIGSGTQVRYYTKKDGFRMGGVVVSAHNEKKSADGGTEGPHMTLRPNFGKQSMMWTQPYAEIVTLYVPIDPASLLMQRQLAESLRTVNGNLTTVSNYVRALEARVAALEASLR